MLVDAPSVEVPQGRYGEECVPPEASLIESALEDGREWRAQPLPILQGMLARS
ncbi:MAG TPA: hypothetical protein VF794_13855 [Archangium sp.]|uniref:hypothetical protein n=1 Tax=Archangium sp. TaxID=1872627 RepID=UPI002ED7AB1E